MRLSLWVGVRQPWASLLEAAEHVDRQGWDGLYVADHFMRDVGEDEPVETPTLESTSVLAALAVSTTSVRLGTLVLGNTYRHPAVVANWAATIDNLSGGRLVLGIGAGWQANEHRQYGIDLPPPGERLRRFDEACRVITGLLRSPTTTFAGAYYQLNEAICEPKPLQTRLPLLIGGRRDRMLGVVARHADEWNIWATPDQLRERSAVLVRHCDRIQRDPATIRRSVQAQVLLTNDRPAADKFVAAQAPRAAIAGSVDQLAEFVGGLRDEGAEEFIVPDQFLGRGTARLDALSAIREALAHV